MSEGDFSAYSWVADYPEEEQDPFLCFCGREVTAINDYFLRCVCGKFWTQEGKQVPESNTFTERDFARVKYKVVF